MAESEPQADEPRPAPADEPELARQIRRAIEAHPILRDQKKLVVETDGRRVEVGGSVFTLDMYRQLVDLLRRVPGADQIRFTAEPEIKPPGFRLLEGRVPTVSPGPSNVWRDYSTRTWPKAR